MMMMMMSEPISTVLTEDELKIPISSLLYELYVTVRIKAQMKDGNMNRTSDPITQTSL